MIALREHHAQTAMDYGQLIYGTSDLRAQQKDTFFFALCRYMQDLKIGNNKLSKITGIPKSTISRYRNGTRKPCFDYLAAICIALRLQTCRQRHLFAVSKMLMPDERSHCNERDYIVREFLDSCPYDKRFSVCACNARLRAIGEYPLTLLMDSMEEQR